MHFTILPKSYKAVPQICATQEEFVALWSLEGRQESLDSQRGRRTRGDRRQYVDLGRLARSLMYQSSTFTTAGFSPFA
jgi:hypothetical protein